ncbi:FliM/FliN family flagellar motor switch protein [Caenimonas sp. SL110]|uniref:FliM/FliN family flagellar motor switch protein n=1 Tax=Caenimonas sp. SL110 TaxID=1450524 RepID=UPI00069CF2D6|nr:FliM/FliN family flagellar motor switch protein [Caenimonas sp. SL110]
MNTDAASARLAGAPTSAQVISLVELNGEPAHRASSADAKVLDDYNPLHAVRTRLQVCVGETELTVGELLGAREHQVLVLDRTVDQAVDLMLEGKVVARGQLVAVDGSFALRITELPHPLRT